MTHEAQANEISITKTARLPGTMEAVFDFIAAQDVLPIVLTGYGPLPGVVGTTEVTGPWDKVGSARVIQLDGGGSAREQVTRYERPTRFSYRVWDFTHPVLKTLAVGARGDWTFTPSLDGGVEVRWTYTFTARNGLARVPLSAVGHLLWSGYMQVALDNANRVLAQRKGE